MIKDDLEQAIIGIAISHIERYCGGKLSIIHSEQLYKELKADMFNMYASWWNAHFPHFHFGITIKSSTSVEPKVEIKWTENGQVIDNWNTLTFSFNPARLENGLNLIEAYDRAMRIL